MWFVARRWALTVYLCTIYLKSPPAPCHYCTHPRGELILFAIFERHRSIFFPYHFGRAFRSTSTANPQQILHSFAYTRVDADLTIAGFGGGVGLVSVCLIRVFYPETTLQPYLRGGVYGRIFFDDVKKKSTKNDQCYDTFFQYIFHFPLRIDNIHPKVENNEISSTIFLAVAGIRLIHNVCIHEKFRLNLQWKYL